MKNLNEQITRIKSLFNDSRLYGNLVEQNDGSWLSYLSKNLKKKNSNGNTNVNISINDINLDDVETLQNSLLALGYDLPNYGADGKYGNETEKALNNFKRDNNLEENGVLDDETKNIMLEKLKNVDINLIKQQDYNKQDFSSLDGKIKHNYSGKAAKNIQRLIDVMNNNGITNPVTQVGMLAVIGKETNFINKKELGYHNTSNERIKEIFSMTRKLSNSELDSLKSDYNNFFNYVYNGRIGNNNISDGSKYVGRGFNQITGKANYEKYGNIVGQNLVGNPDILLNDDVAANAAVKFLSSKGVRNFSDPIKATNYFADVNAGRVSSRAREKSMEVLKNFDIVNV